jgi:hypothetical protein
VLAGCATDVDEQLPPEPAPEAQRESPDRSLNTQLRDPKALLRDAIEIDKGLERVSPIQTPPGPGPIPE